MVECLKPCCCPKAPREGLQPPKCRFAAGVYQNVTVEIGQDCQIIRLEPADKSQINLCDPCHNTNKNTKSDKQ